MPNVVDARDKLASLFTDLLKETQQGESFEPIRAKSLSDYADLMILDYERAPEKSSDTNRFRAAILNPEEKGTV